MMLIEKRKFKINIKNINFVLHNPSILKAIIQGKSKDEVTGVKNRLLELQIKRGYLQESLKFISSLKKTSPYHTGTNYQPKLNRLCYTEDWDNKEFKNILKELQTPTHDAYIDRKDWEFAIGILAMKRFNKLNDKCTAIGIGAGKEQVLFYLANHLKNVYATDLYDGKEWNNFAPFDFPNNPKKYAPFPYKEDALTVLRMDGTRLEFPSETFDIAFSFSSIEHFGGRNHSGSLKSMKEIERVLKKDGIAIIATEYIINDKDHPEFFNRKTIYSDLLDKLDSLKLVEPLDLRITTKTLDTVMDYYKAEYWGTANDYEFQKSHPHLLLRLRNILYTSVMLVFKKQ